MPLVEIIMGKETSQETLAKTMDYVQKIRKTPIVVNDSRGFYTSRVFGTYTGEGVAMLAGEINKIKITEYAPKKIKQSVTGNGNASKEQLSEMVKNILNLDIKKSEKFDATDALGAAICHFYQKSNNQTPKKSWKEYVISNPEKLI